MLTARFEGDFETGINACVECCDRHVGEHRVALIWADPGGQRGEYTFEQLRDRSAQVANLLTAHGVEPGDRVSGLLPRTPDLVALILGVLRAGAAYQPLFTAFGSDAIAQRLGTSQAKVVVTDHANRSKLDGLTDSPVIMTVGGGGTDIDFGAELDRQSTDFAPVMRTGTDALLLMSTSGTTGLPKGVQVPIRSLVGMRAYMEYGLDVRDDDVFWNIADPGWAYGLYYAVIGPLLLGHQTILYDGGFSVESLVSLIDELGVTNLAGAPTAYRMIIAAGPHAVSSIEGRLRVASSAGEPLNPEIMRWFEDHLQCPVFDQYGQTESGMMLANHHGLRHAVRPGSAGFAMPGFSLAVVDEQAQELPVGTEGVLAVRLDQSPLFFFDGYLGAEGQGWVNGYYLTGDTVEENDDGSISFVGRSDDVISSAGYRIGPFDVESSLLEHGAVAESAVVGKPDAERGEIVKAFVVLHPGHTGDEALRVALTQHVRSGVGKHAFPREIEFLDELPKTPSGKIQRFVLRQR
ncbi:MAG: AMP-binding protein [Actinomycetota bacterium]